MSIKSTKKDSALSKVQNLYLMQVELWNFLEGAQSDKDSVQSAQKTLKEFTALLKEVDWRVMGGEDVLESLSMIPKEVTAKLKKKSPTSAKRQVAMKTKTKKPTASKKKAVKRK